LLGLICAVNVNMGKMEAVAERLLIIWGGANGSEDQGVPVITSLKHISLDEPVKVAARTESCIILVTSLLGREFQGSYVFRKCPSHIINVLTCVRFIM
jgi:hypothetical protein